MSYSSPIYLDVTGIAVPLQRVEIGAAVSDGRFDESWLQQLLFENPQSIPFLDVDPALASVIPLCREMSTPAGPIDLVFVSSSGKIVLIETKLFRNPESRRAVVGQILDYAKELTSWRFEQLAAKVGSATKGGPDHLLNTAVNSFPQLNVARFVDSINRSLARADMTLLIIGDGIQTGTEALVSFLERHGGLQFCMGLIEVAVFRTPGGGRFVQPRVLAKTELLRRTLLLSEEGRTVEEALPGATTDTDEEPTYLQTFWAEFQKRLRLDDITQPVPPKTPRGTNIYFPMPPSGSVAWVSAFVATSKHQVGVYLVLSSSYSKFAEFFAALQSRQAEIEAEVGTPLDWQRQKSFTVTTRREFSDLDSPEQRNDMLRYLSDMTNRFVNAFRPRLMALLRDENSS